MVKKYPGKLLRKNRLPRIRAKLFGTAKRPRLTVFKSNYALYVQCIDDERGAVLFSETLKGKNAKAAETLGAQVAGLLKKKGITAVVFDRSGYKYHGVVAVLADAVRQGGVTL